MRFVNKNLTALLLAFACFSVILPGNAVHAQTTTFKVTGPCISCSTDQLVNLVNGMNGCSSAAYDKSNFMLSFTMDKAKASEIDIQLELTMHGYDAGDFQHDAKAKLPECCSNGMRGESFAAAKPINAAPAVKTEAIRVNTDAALPEPTINDLDDVEDPGNWEDPSNLRKIETEARRGDDDSAEPNMNSILEDSDDEDDKDLMNWSGDKAKKKGGGQ